MNLFKQELKLFLILYCLLVRGQRELTIGDLGQTGKTALSD
jgi:hypothetical protein